MAYTYNEASLTYNNANISYNGDREIVISAGVLAIFSTLPTSSVSASAVKNVNFLSLANSILAVTINTERNAIISASVLSVRTTLNISVISAIRNLEPFPVIEMFAETVFPSGSVYVPPLSIETPIQPILTIAGGTTTARMIDNGITYNQAGFTYNDIRGIYGGYTGSTDDFQGELSASQQAPTFMTK